MALLTNINQYYLLTGWWYTYPSEKWWSESQLGWWNSQLNGKIKFMFQTTNQWSFTLFLLAIVGGTLHFRLCHGRSSPFCRPYRLVTTLRGSAYPRPSEATCCRDVALQCGKPWGLKTNGIKPRQIYIYIHCIYIYRYIHVYICIYIYV